MKNIIRIIILVLSISLFLSTTTYGANAPTGEDVAQMAL